MNDLDKVKLIYEEINEISKTKDELNSIISKLTTREYNLKITAQDTCPHPYEDLIDYKWYRECPHCGISGIVDVPQHGEKLVEYRGWVDDK